jgi:hypothetical protein
MTISLIHSVILETTISPFRSLFPTLFGWCTWLAWSEIEEVGFQAHEKFFDQENCWGLIFVGAKLQLQCSKTSGPAYC